MKIFRSSKVEFHEKFNFKEELYEVLLLKKISVFGACVLSVMSLVRGRSLYGCSCVLMCIRAHICALCFFLPFMCALRCVSFGF